MQPQLLEAVTQHLSGGFCGVPTPPVGRADPVAELGVLVFGAQVQHQAADFGEQAGWSPREASDSDDVVGDGSPLPVRAGSLALAGFEPFGVPFVGAQVERAQRLLGGGP